MCDCAGAANGGSAGTRIRATALGTSMSYGRLSELSPPAYGLEPASIRARGRLCRSAAANCTITITVPMV